MSPGCPNCGSLDTTEWAVATDIEYRTSDEQWLYRRCGGCGVLYLADPPVDRLAEIYPSNYYSYVEGSSSLAGRLKAALDRRQLRRFLAGVPGDHLTLLDVGGGTGELAALARSVDERVTETIVVDLDPACEPVAAAAGHRYLLGSIDDVDLPAVDAVLLLNLIEHVRDPVATLGRLAGALSPNGRILVKTPNTDAWDARLFRHRSWGGYHCPRHWVLFDPPSFRDAARRAGFDVVSLHLTQGAPFWAVSLFHELERRRLVRRRDGEAIHEHGLFGPLTAIVAGFDFLRRPLAPTSQMFAVLRRA